MREVGRTSPILQDPLSVHACVKLNRLSASLVLVDTEVLVRGDELRAYKEGI